jgi:hypothetical protein
VDFLEAFMTMKSMVEELYSEQKKSKEGVPYTKFEGEGGGGDPPKTPPSMSSSSSSLKRSSSFKKHSKKTSFDLCLVKLDVKFDFPIYDGELNAKKLDNWIK